MKKRWFALYTAVLVMVLPMETLAGNINAAESRVIAAASETYTYNGVEYRTSDGAMAALMDELSADNRELTEAQADELISRAYGSIGQGVREGYLEPVNGTGEAGGTGQESEAGSELKDEDLAWAEQLIVESSKEKATEESTETTETGAEVSVGMGVTTAEDSGIVTATDNGGEVVFTSSIPVKNTGFDLGSVRTATIFLVVLLIGCGIWVARNRKMTGGDQ